MIENLLDLTIATQAVLRFAVRTEPLQARLPAPGSNRDLHADQATDRGRPHPTGAHHGLRGDAFRGNHDVRDAPVF